MKHLLVYYSFTGNIESVLPLFKELIEVDIFKLELVDPYPRDGKEFLPRYREEIKHNLLPAYKKSTYKTKDYDSIIFVAPNWGNTIPPVCKTYLANNNFEDKTIIPIVTHGGNGKADMITQIKELSKSNDVKEELVFYQRNLTLEELKEYFIKVGVISEY